MNEDNYNILETGVFYPIFSCLPVSPPAVFCRLQPIDASTAVSGIQVIFADCGLPA